MLKRKYVLFLNDWENPNHSGYSKVWPQTYEDFECLHQNVMLGTAQVQQYVFYK